MLLIDSYLCSATCRYIQQKTVVEYLSREKENGPVTESTSRPDTYALDSFFPLDHHHHDHYQHHKQKRDNQFIDGTSTWIRRRTVALDPPGPRKETLTENGVLQRERERERAGVFTCMTCWCSSFTSCNVRFNSEMSVSRRRAVASMSASFDVSASFCRLSRSSFSQ